MPEPKGEYITKSDAAVVYRRSERSLSRDITNAIKFRDDAILNSVELQLEDGTLRAGSELSIEEIVDLRDRGLNPTWLLQRRWLQTTYGRRDEPPRREAQLPRVESTLEGSNSTRLPLPEELPQRVAVLMTQNEALKQTNADLRAQAERLEKELDRRAEERREETELQKQNNVLMQQVYNLLSKWQEAPGQVTILPAPQPPAPVQYETQPSVKESAVVSRKETDQAVAKTPGSDTRAKRSRKRGRKTQSEATSQPERKPALTKGSKSLPTLGQTIRSLFRR